MQPAMMNAAIGMHESRRIGVRRANVIMNETLRELRVEQHLDNGAAIRNVSAGSLGDWNVKRVREFRSERTGLRRRVECSEILGRYRNQLSPVQLKANFVEFRLTATRRGNPDCSNGSGRA